MTLEKLLLGTAICLSLTAPAFADVKFGALYPFSGPLALLGEESARGLELAVEKVNAKGGVQGEQIVLEKGDAVDNNQSAGEARRLISLSGVKAVFGTYSSGRSIAASQVSELAGIPYLELGAVADEITSRNFKYIVRTNPAAFHLGKNAVDMLIASILPRMNMDPADVKLGIIYEDSAYGTSVANHEEQTALQNGLEVTVKSGYPANTVDLSSLVLELREKGVNVLMHTGYQNDAVLFLQQAHEAGYKPKVMIGGGGGHSMQPTADAVGHELIEGVYSIDFTQISVNTSNAPGLDAFVEAYRTKYGEEPRSGHSLNNYAGALVLLDAIDKAKDFEPDTIMEAVRAIDVPAGDYSAIYGYKFDETGQNIAAFMTGMQWQDGKLTTVFPESAAVSEMRFGE